MAQGCGNCNYHGDIKTGNSLFTYFCLLTQNWTLGTSCQHYKPYINMSDSIRVTLAIEKKHQIDEENRRSEENNKEQESEVRRSQEKKEERRFKLKTLILSNLLSIIGAFIIAYLVYLWKFR